MGLKNGSQALASTEDMGKQFGDIKTFLKGEQIKQKLDNERLVVCDCCGEIFRRVKWNCRGCKSVVWGCITRIENPSKCQTRTVKEELLHQAD